MMLETPDSGLRPHDACQFFHHADNISGLTFVRASLDCHRARRPLKLSRNPENKFPSPIEPNFLAKSAKNSHKKRIFLTDPYHLMRKNFIAVFRPSRLIRHSQSPRFSLINIAVFHFQNRFHKTNQNFHLKCRKKNTHLGDYKKSFFLRAKKIAFFARGRNPLKHWMKPRFFHKDSSKIKSVSILP